MATVNSGCGVTWPLPFFITFPGERGDSIRAFSPLPNRSMGGHREIQMQHVISFDSTRQDHCGREGVWPGSSMGAPAPSMSFFPGEGSMEAHPANWHRCQLGYAFMWLNKGMLHIPLSNKGHISTMIDSMPSRSAWGHLSQLEVNKLIQCGDQVVYPKGLKGG